MRHFGNRQKYQIFMWGSKLFLEDFDEFRGSFFTFSIFTFALIFRIMRAHSEMSSSFLLAYKLPASSPDAPNRGDIRKKMKIFEIVLNMEGVTVLRTGVFVVLFLAAVTD